MAPFHLNKRGKRHKRAGLTQSTLLVGTNNEDKECGVHADVNMPPKINPHKLYEVPLLDSV